MRSSWPKGSRSTAIGEAELTTYRSGDDRVTGSLPVSRIVDALDQPLHSRVGGSLTDPLLDGSPAMRDIYGMVKSIADTDATVLLRGESGVGKEVIAHAIHDSSHRAQ